MNPRQLLVLVALMPIAVLAVVGELSAAKVVALNAPDNETFTIWGWADIISYVFSLVFTPLFLLGYFFAYLPLNAGTSSYIKRLAAFLVFELLTYSILYYFWFYAPLALASVTYFPFAVWLLIPALLTLLSALLLKRGFRMFRQT